VFKKVAPKKQLELLLTMANRNADRTVGVSWTTAYEQEVEKYEVERSTEGNSFTGVITVVGEKLDSLSIYSKTDLGAMAGDNYYRIKASKTDGGLAFSEVVKVDALKAYPTITVYPNPVSGKKLQLLFEGQPNGSYQIQVQNLLGQVLQNNSITVTGNQKFVTISLGSSVNPGQYQVTIIGPDGKKNKQNILVE
jgi:hypothetical protein